MKDSVLKCKNWFDLGKEGKIKCWAGNIKWDEQRNFKRFSNSKEKIKFKSLRLFWAWNKSPQKLKREKRMEFQFFMLSDIIRMERYKIFYFSYDHQLIDKQTGEILK